MSRCDRGPTTKRRNRNGDQGASLVGLLAIVVVLGVLMAGAVVGLHSFNTTNSAVAPAANAAAAANVASGLSNGARSNSGGVPPTVGCIATADAAKTASALYLANSGGRYPARWTDLTGSSPRLFALPEHTSVNRANPRELDGPGWQLIMSGGGTVPSSLTCRSVAMGS